jgi:opacity protein-like surface antigen
MKNLLHLAGVALCASLASMAPSSVAAQSIDFNDGIIGASISSHYNAFGVSFQNAEWTSFTSPSEATVGAGGLKFTNIQGDPFQPKLGNPIIANFASGLSFFSILGLNIGANGARVEVLDINGNIVGSSETYGLGLGESNHQTLSFTRSQGDIRSARFFQPLSANENDGLLWDNMTYRVNPVAVVPEPGTYALMVSGLLAMCLVYRRRRV